MAAMVRAFFPAMTADATILGEDIALIKRKENDFNFSIDNDSLAYRLMRLQNTGKRITVTYKQYTAPLPWRGKSDVVATGVIEN